MDAIQPFAFLASLAIVVGVFVFWIRMLIECVTKEPDTGNTKIVWVIIILFANLIGAALYYFVRRPQRYVELGR